MTHKKCPQLEKARAFSQIPTEFSHTLRSGVFWVRGTATIGNKQTFTLDSPSALFCTSVVLHQHFTVNNYRSSIVVILLHSRDLAMSMLGHNTYRYDLTIATMSMNQMASRPYPRWELINSGISLPPVEFECVIFTLDIG